MGMFKDIAKLKQQGKDVAKEQGRPTGMFGMLKDMPNQIHNATEMVGSVQAAQATQVRLAQVGVPAKATIGQVRPTGALVNFNPVAELDLEVTVEGKAAYQVTTSQAIPQVLLPQLVPGGPLAVRVDPEDPSSLMIDWAAQQSGV
jgi:hypothetical protein